MSVLIKLCEQGMIPDALTRWGMRKLMAQRLKASGLHDIELAKAMRRRILTQLRDSPIAVETEAANEQHYEVPAAFFHRHLGPRLKYSCALYEQGNETLAQAEEAMFALYAERAGIEDGQRILDLGCGWGSLSLWLAERFPQSQIVGLSNSHGQREFIEQRAKERGLDNVTILTDNVVHADFPMVTVEGHAVSAGFDRIVSIEMLEHMRNYGLLFKKLAGWLNDDGAFFVHIFVHRELTYFFEDKDASDWMTRYFFSGGIMPSEHLFDEFAEDLTVAQQWWVNGQHYEQTANHWLANMDAAKADILPLFARCYGQHDAAIWFNRWRMFYMAVAELFGYDEGKQWGVAHYLLRKNA